MVIPPNNISKSTSGATSSSQTGSVKVSPPQHHSGREGKVSDTSDPVSLSPEAQKMAQVEAAISQHSGVDENRVAALREAIQNGQYTIDSHSLSEKMLDMDRKFS